MSRGVEEQLRTARIVLAQFIVKIGEHEETGVHAERIDQLREGWATWEARVRELGGEIEITHACPPGDANLTPCCGRTPFELPRTDRITLDRTLVTCMRQAVAS